MGGRGQWSHVAAHFQNVKNIVIRRSKISNYLLNKSKSKGKAEFFNSLGYNMRNQSRMQSDIRNELKTARIRVSKPNKYGTISYQANITMGISKKSTVVIGFHKKKNDKKVYLTTARPYKGKKDDF